MLAVLNLNKKDQNRCGFVTDVYFFHLIHKKNIFDI